MNKNYIIYVLIDILDNKLKNYNILEKLKYEFDTIDTK